MPCEGLTDITVFLMKRGSLGVGAFAQRIFVTHQYVRHIFLRHV